MNDRRCLSSRNKLQQIGICLLVLASAALYSGDAAEPQEAAKTLRKAVEFFRKNVSAEGAYLWRYSADLELREGEGAAGKLTAWVQPPGTPTVGDAYLYCYWMTRDSYYLEAAVETAEALARGQLHSGGWDYRIEFDPKTRQRYAYRSDGPSNGRNTTTLDDDTTQAALRFIMRVDRATEFKNQVVHGAAMYALNALLLAQYPNGAWAQRFSSPPDPAKFPIKRAAIPESWSRTYPKNDYRSYYTFNDNTIADMIETLFLAAEVYGEQKYRSSAEKAGSFIILSQLPEPQPAWAQQYNAACEPAWARRFEPPAVTGGESQGVMRILLNLYNKTGDRKYLEPIPRALAYLERSKLSDGRLARFYELRTNRPLYFTKEYVLTYRDNDLPTHYGFKVGSNLKSIDREYRRLLENGPDKKRPYADPKPPKKSTRLAAQVKEIIGALDSRGAWLADGELRRAGNYQGKVIDTRTFIKNVRTLAEYAGAK